MRAMESTPLVAIVGAGFSGAATAIHLLRDASLAAARIVLLERPGHGTGGVAYDVTSEHLLLNVPAHRMSAFDDVPDDFLAFLRGRDTSCEPSRYARRRDYGEYLAARLDTAARAAYERSGGRVTFEPVAGHVRDLQRDPLGRLRAIVDAESTVLEFTPDAVLLATGNVATQPPRWLDPWMVREHRYRDAWAPGAIVAGGRDEVVLLLGTGLTMVDVVVELRARGFEGRIVAVSRHGLLPRVDDGPPPPPVPDDLPPALAADATRSGARGLLHALHAHADAIAARGRDWRSMIAAVRARVPALWAALPDAERARFLRHARVYWETHRHRMPATLGAKVGAEIRGGRLEIVAGRVLDATHGSDGRLRVRLRGRGATHERELQCDRIVNCTGAGPGAPLLPPWPSLLERGAVSRDVLGLGVLTDDDGRLLARDGRAQPDLFYAGPMWRAQHWESTAVPELRLRLPAVARAIAGRLGLAHAG
jgi:uncharacterized NAD(P)/FAD-binding protein YdhS